LTPSIGRIVLVRVDGGSDEAPELRPAIVVRVPTGPPKGFAEPITVHVFYDPFDRDTVPADLLEGTGRYQWRWPPRV
jgi:hypothetical protein